MRRLLSLSVLLLAGAAPAGAATVAAPPLTARMGEDEWRVRFEQPGVTLRAARGTLGFRTATGTWERATRVVSRRRAPNGGLRLEVATTDPGRPMAVRVERAGPGIVRLRAAVAGDPAGVTHARMGFQAVGRERYLGFGERSNAVDQRGRDVLNYVEEGAYEEDERALIAPFVSPASFRPRDDSTYFPMPWLLSTRGYGVLEESTRISTFRLGTADAGTWSVEVEGPRLSLLVMAGPRPAAVLRRLTTVTGRQPRPAAPWFFGPWFQTGQADVVAPEQELGYVEALRDGDAPVSAAETHLRYLPCAAHADRR